MKKLFALLLTLLLILSSLTACKVSDVGTGTSGDVSDQIGEGDDVNVEGEGDNAGDNASDGEANNDGGKTENNDNKDNEGSKDDKDDKDDKTDSSIEELGNKEYATPKKTSTSGLKFVLNEDKKSYTLVNKGTATATELVIDGYKGLPVTHIGYAAFENDTAITSVTIGDSVEYIGMYAFSKCSKITSLTMGKGVKNIDDAAFRYCSSLTTLTVGSSVERIGYQAFYNSAKLNTIKLPSTIRVIERYAFDKTAYFNNSANWQSNVIYISNCLYRAKSALSGKYTVKDGTVIIADYAFGECATFTGIVIPNSVKSIGFQAFFKATKMTSVTIGTGVERIGDQAFYNSGFYNASGNWKNNVLFAGDYLIKAKTTISGAYTVPSGTRAIADLAFGSCDKVTSVNVTDSVVGIGDYAFNGCASLTSATIGSGVKRIGANAFKGCAALKSVTFKKTSTWSVDGRKVPTSRLSDKASAAALLNYECYSEAWKKS